MEPSEVVVVRLGGGAYAVPLPAVAEVGRPAALTRVPGLPGWVPGVVNWRGRVLAVLDLRGLLGADPAPLGRGGRLVVLAHEGVRVGLLTDSVEGTLALAPETVEPPLVSLAAGGLLCGQVTRPGGPLGLLDPWAVLRLAEQLPRPRRAS